MRAILLLLALMPLNARAQMAPAGASQVQIIDYVPDGLFTLGAAPGYQLMIELAPDERIENVAVGDSGAWQVTANKRGDRLFVKLVQPGISTNMIVATDARLYSFELTPVSETARGLPYSVRFRYPSPAPAAPPDAAMPDALLGRYKVRGAAELRPSGIHDDGVHTYVEWPEDRALPAIYAINDQGKEMLVNGMMRDGRMVIDSVQAKLVFRIDRRSAIALRVAPKAQ
ncbi:MAG: TrbG/VirB9 family P-type conjugative transfer protein [Sphingomonas sp.]|uniref:TrbG/VirB9 family P-type conjugative transfer protein n=1 Tax=Sphingomonas sp. TaxID=28214 RepID=UPI0025DA8281|nr:TrbG/VirB9 family P-type conjugative transfer protein [Sphingomonas sp.]MBX3564018.1 TrbG/VirB9 family P-type conjugative transfer protein [Sphingomonas sp.]